MKLTETEARQKYCCQPIAFNGLQKLCGASGCMAWRWSYKVDPEYVPGDNGFIPPPPPMVVSDKGYCGLVGKI